MKPPVIPLPSTPNWVDVADLRVQQQLADIAERMMWLTAVQLVLAIAGTIALVVTLILTSKATTTTIKALRLQTASERAVLVPNNQRFYVGPCCSHHENGPMLEEDRAACALGRFQVSLLNVGRTVALVKRSNLVVMFNEKPERPDFPNDSVWMHRAIDKGTEYVFDEITRSYNWDQWVKLRDQTAKHWLYGFVEYDDILAGETTHRVSFAYEVDGRPGALTVKEFGGDIFWSST